jgi:hypothetical protein
VVMCVCEEMCAVEVICGNVCVCVCVCVCGFCNVWVCVEEI